MTSNENYTLEDEAELLKWGARVAAVSREELAAWVVKTIAAEPACRAERETRRAVAALYAGIFERVAATDHPAAERCRNLAAKLREIEAANK